MSRDTTGAEARRSETRPDPGTAPAGEAEEWLSEVEQELARLEGGLRSDASPAAARAALYRVLSVTATTNFRASLPAAPGLPPMARGPVQSPPGSIPPALSGPRSSPAPGAGPTAPFGGGLATRLEGIAASLHRLIELIALRIGATGYSIGVSFPAGISVSVDFTLRGSGSPAGVVRGGAAPPKE